MAATLDLTIDVPAPARRGWADVVAELTRSITARAPRGELIAEPGVVGVRSGAAPIVWVHDVVDPAWLAAMLATAPGVVEAYVRGDDLATARLLEETGWRPCSVATQLVHTAGTAPATALPAGYTVHELTAADLPEFRAVLTEHGDTTAEVVDACYGPEFFVRAAPAWLYGVRDASGALVGTIGVRRQHSGAMLFGLSVHDAHRRAGVGRALVEAALACAYAHGAAFCHAAAEDESVRLALACGFADVGTWRRLDRGQD